MRAGALNSICDVDGIVVGHAQSDDLKSGVSVVSADAPFVASCHVMGGAPGTRETDLLAPDKSVEAVDALVLSGGSGFGVAAGDGVAEALKDEGRGFAVGPVRVPIVPGAILFDLLAGGDHGWARNPYPALGRAAYAARRRDVALGSVGAGTGCLTASLKGGLGTASVLLPSGITVGALVAVNALGDAVVAGGPEFWAAPFEIGGEFGGRGIGGPMSGWPATKMGPAQNTTIAVIATDAVLTKAQCQRLAVAAHDGMARALVPSHTPMDGDLVFAASHGRKVLDNASAVMLGHAASCVLARAIARGVYEARPAPGDILPCWRARFG